MGKGHRRMRNTEVTPMTLEEFMWDKTVRMLLNYLGRKRADNPEDAVGIVTVSEDIGMSLTDVNYNMKKLCVTGLGGNDSGFLYLTDNRGMGAYRACLDLEEALENPAK